MAENETMGTVETGASTVDNATASGEVVAPGGEAVQSEQQVPESASAGSEGAKPAQSRQDNAHYKGLRKKAEAYEGMSGKLMELARAKGLQPKNADEAMTMLQADAAGKEHAVFLQEQAEAEAALDARMKGSPEYQAMKADAEAYRMQKAMAADLAAIREVDASVTSLEQLGDEYVECIDRGMTGLEAYYYLKGKGAVREAAMPPSTGAAGGHSDVDRDFTSEELDRLGDELKNPKVLEKAIRSLRKLKF